MKIINPATGGLIGELEADSRASIETKYQAARGAQLIWQQEVPVKERVQCIKNFQDLLKENLEALAMELSLEVGKPLQEARGEISGAAAKCQFFIDESENVLRSQEVNVDGNTRELIAYEPLGVIANISAWNYPYLVGINIFVPALICGNAVLYKPSEFAVTVGVSITKLLLQAGIPENVFQLIMGEADAGKTLCELPLDGYFFTGSYATGKAIVEAVAPKLVPVGLELGGKDPLYVCDELDDIKQVAESAAEGVFYNNGQSCCSVERIYVHEKVYPEFLQYFLDAARSLQIGDPQAATTGLGAITRKQQLDFFEDLIDDALQKGAKLELGGKRIQSNGNFFEATVLSEVNHQMRIMQEETFGPLIGIQKVPNDEQAVHLMNDTDYGLTASVFCANQKRGKALLAKINAGTVYLNCCDRVSAYLPWSGRGQSGLGSTLSRHGLYAFCNPKAFHIRT